MNSHLLATRELELGTTQSLNDGRLPTVAGAHGHDGLSDAHTRYGALGLAERTTHPSLEPANSNTLINGYSTWILTHELDSSY